VCIGASVAFRRSTNSTLSGHLVSIQILKEEESWFLFDMDVKQIVAVFILVEY
jgi:hypothetical protein